jgi:hypothetical protein
MGSVSSCDPAAALLFQISSLSEGYASRVLNRAVAGEYLR